MKEREIACIYYEAEGRCQKGRDGTFRKACQRCDWYKAVKGGRPARKDLRRQKKEEVRNKEFQKEMNNL